MQQIQNHSSLSFLDDISAHRVSYLTILGKGDSIIPLNTSHVYASSIHPNVMPFEIGAMHTAQTKQIEIKF